MEVKCLLPDKHRKKLFTIIVIPHNEETVLNLRIPLYLFQAMGILLVCGLVCGHLWLSDVLHVQENATEISRLQATNRALHEDIDRMTMETERLLEHVQEMELLTLEVREMIDLPAGERRQEEAGWDVFLTSNEQPGLLASRGGNPVIARNMSNISHLQGFLPEFNEDLSQLREDIRDHQREMASTPSIWPAQGRVTSEFGPRASPFTGRREFHYGIDIAGPRGSLIVAAAQGKVDVATYRRGMGNTVIIEHGYGYRTVYAHLSGFAVAPGHVVEKGEKIGYMGSTGFSTGPHLHYEVHVNGVAVDPRNFFP